MGGKRSLATAFLLALLAAPAFGFQQTGQTVRHRQVQVDGDDSIPAEVQQAEAAMQKGDFATAEKLLNQAVAEHPEAYRAWFDLGYLNTQTKHPTAAVYAYRKAVAAKPDVFESNLNLGLLLAKQGDKNEAARFLKAATQLTPSANVAEGQARAWVSLGLVVEDADPEQALAAFAEAAKLNPKDAEPHLAAGSVLERQNKLDAALKEYQQAQQLEPRSEDAAIGLANVYSKQKNLAQAEVQLRKVLELDPGNEAAKGQLGKVLLAEGKTAEAAPLLKDAKGSPGGPQSALERGSAFLKNNNLAAAEEQFRAAVQAAPDEAEPHYALGSLLMQQKRYPEAQAELIEAVKLKPDEGEIYGNLAFVASQNRDYSLAIRALDARSKYLPENAATYFLRATCYDNLKIKPQAIENYKQFLASDGGKMPDQEWQARHRLMAIDPGNAHKYEDKK